eukprot:2526374-Prymnesium_polylepis.1
MCRRLAGGAARRERRGDRCGDDRRSARGGGWRRWQWLRWRVAAAVAVAAVEGGGDGSGCGG